MTQAGIVNPSGGKNPYGFCNASERDYVVILEDFKRSILAVS
ncbi:hypothetical protein [Anaplasma phagocytophilum]|nr:hypothetical protein [Anaplasma phagocytophilum]